MDVSAKEFYDGFKAMVNEKAQLLWSNFHSDKNYTQSIIILLQNLVEKFGLQSQKEFYRVDVVGYNDINDAEAIKNGKKLSLNPSLWNIKVVIEHENNSKDWSYEAIKLVPIRCQLKVIICYNDFDKRNDDELGDLNKLKVVLSWMQKIKFYDSKDEYLFIIGNTWNKGIKDFGYLGYVVKNNIINSL